MERMSSRCWSFVPTPRLKKGGWPWLLLIAAWLLPFSSAEARLLQIIHTNDLHSFMEESDEPNRGGYAAVKAAIEQAKAEAAARGIASVVLDAGDFSEGTPLFLADDGKQAWRAIDAMGYDAVTIGNHDWLIGAKEMDKIVSAIQPRTPFLAANMNLNSAFPNIKKAVRPYTEIVRDGLKVAILGVTTDELVYRWRMNGGGGIGDPAEAANKHLATLRSRNDLVIVLSHLGLLVDLKFVPKIRGADLIVGGHSHNRLDVPMLAKDKDSKKVPIVQTGEHGKFIGRILMDVQPGQEPKLVKYQLMPVYSQNSQAPEASGVKKIVTDARKMLENRYSPEWLYNTVGFTNTPMVRPNEKSTVWGGFFMETVRKTAGAEIAIDPGEFHGVSQPAGIITSETLMKSYPRVFEMNQLMGWTIWKIKVPGWMLQILVDQVVRQGLHLNTAGLTFDVNSNSPLLKATNLKVGGRAVNWLKTYTIAVTEGVGRGTMEISYLLQLLFHPKDTGVPVWSALERRIRANGGAFSGDAAASPLGMIR